MRKLRGRLVRRDGSYSEVAVSLRSHTGCIASRELMLGEIVSVEFTDLALLVGQVASTKAGKSQLKFFGMPSYSMR